jgi:hypothetical protein
VKQKQPNISCDILASLSLQFLGLDPIRSESEGEEDASELGRDIESLTAIKKILSVLLFYTELWLPSILIELVVIRGNSCRRPKCLQLHSDLCCQAAAHQVGQSKSRYPILLRN